ncbi:uncharacterized protein [Oscarella lobularis]|uniref:uncharacterized protein n=1 Tax=Oscarella lobularis TaxID=121494 RepID=UPI003313CBAD
MSALQAFERQCHAAGFDFPEKLKTLLTAKLSAASMKKRHGRPESDRERRARAYLALKNSMWYGGGLGRASVVDGPFEKSGPTYCWPAAVKDVLRGLYPEDVKNRADPGVRGPSTCERPIVDVELGEILEAFDAKRVDVAKRSRKEI